MSHLDRFDPSLMHYIPLPNDISNTVLLYRGRDKVLPELYFSLGRYGAVVNATAIAWVLFLDVVYCFPTTMPVTIGNMNYVSVVAMWLAMFVIGLWFTSKKGKFTGPKINMAQITERRLAAIHGGMVTVAVGDDLTSNETISVMKSEVLGCFLGK
jgi:choline transport protein